MAYQKYRFTLKSEELKGATQPNIAYIELDDASSDSDALVFGGNLINLFQANLLSIDKALAENYTLTSGTYPAGTNREFRMVMRDASSNVETTRLWNVASGVVPDAFAASLIAAGIRLPGSLGLATSILIAEFTPGASF